MSAIATENSKRSREMCTLQVYSDNELELSFERKTRKNILITSKEQYENFL